MDRVRAMPHSRRPSVVSWVPVKDATGTVRMQMRWHVGEATAQRTPTLAGKTAA